MVTPMDWDVTTRLTTKASMHTLDAITRLATATSMTWKKTDMEIHFQEATRRVQEIFPNFSWGSDHNGQIIIYTDTMESPDLSPYLVDYIQEEN